MSPVAYAYTSGEGDTSQKLPQTEGGTCEATSECEWTASSMMSKQNRDVFSSRDSVAALSTVMLLVKASRG